jgi:hypothetical protein
MIGKISTQRRLNYSVIALADTILNDRNYADVMREYYQRYPKAGYGGMLQRIPDAAKANLLLTDSPIALTFAQRRI